MEEKPRGRLTEEEEEDKPSDARLTAAEQLK